VPLVAGRDFRWTDDGRQQDVAVLSQGLASLLFPGSAAVGRRVRMTSQPNRERVLEVVGVVANARIAEPHATNQLFLFTSLLQEPRRYLELQPPFVLLKSALAPSAVDAQARRTVAALGRSDIVDTHPLRRTFEAALLRERTMRLGAVFFAGLTTLLVFVGLYAVLNVGISTRVPEIGLRMALGASAADIRSMVIRETALIAAVGVVIGIPVAFWSGRLIAGTLTTVGSHDGWGFVVAIALILAIAGTSLLIPLRRASHVAPIQALESR